MSDTKLIETIANLKTRIESLEQRLNQYIGQRTAIQERLKTEHGVKNMTEANARLEELDAQIANETEELTKLVNDIQGNVEKLENELQ